MAKRLATSGSASVSTFATTTRPALASAIFASNYLMRVILSRGSVMSGEWGIRWAGFRVDGA